MSWRGNSRSRVTPCSSTWLSWALETRSLIPARSTMSWQIRSGSILRVQGAKARPQLRRRLRHRLSRRLSLRPPLPCPRGSKRLSRRRWPPAPAPHLRGLRRLRPVGRWSKSKRMREELWPLVSEPLKGPRLTPLPRRAQPRRRALPRALAGRWYPVRLQSPVPF